MKCPICDEPVADAVGKAAHMRLSHQKAMRLYDAMTNADRSERYEAILKVVEFFYGGPVPEWWKEVGGLMDIYDIHGPEVIIGVGRGLRDEARHMEDRYGEARMCDKFTEEQIVFLKSVGIRIENIGNNQAVFNDRADKAEAAYKSLVSIIRYALGEGESVLSKTAMERGGGTPPAMGMNDVDDCQ